jgi:hypothetical protein
MKKILLLTALAMFTGSLIAAEADDIKAAAKKLGNNYSWRTTVAVPEGGGSGGRFRPGPTEGKTDAEGYVLLKMTRGDNSTEAVLKGDKGAAKLEDEWQSLDELSKDGGQPGPAMFVARILRGYKAPAADAPDIASKTKELKKEGDVYSGDLSEEGAKSLLMFRGGRAGGQNAPVPSKAAGTVKFWVKDGKLAKYEYKVSGTVNFNGEDRDIDRTTTVEIKDIGSTKVEVPEEAKKKLS